jgi:hypothetical protein
MGSTSPLPDPLVLNDDTRRSVKVYFRNSCWKCGPRRRHRRTRKFRPGWLRNSTTRAESRWGASCPCFRQGPGRFSGNNLLGQFRLFSTPSAICFFFRVAQNSRTERLSLLSDAADGRGTPMTLLEPTLELGARQAAKIREATARAGDIVRCRGGSSSAGQNHREDLACLRPS